MDKLCEDDLFPSRNQLHFLREQLFLLTLNRNSYSTDVLLWSFQVFCISRKAYNHLRTTCMTLPHPSVLTKLTRSFSMESGLQESAVHEEYLRQKCSGMKEEEREVSVMLDEIHVSHNVTFKGGKIEGTVDGGNEDAGSAQVSCIQNKLKKKR